MAQPENAPRPRGIVRFIRRHASVTIGGFGAARGLYAPVRGYARGKSGRFSRRIGESSFAKRLITGQAAERYFIEHHREFRPFAKLHLQDTTRWGCGFDFRLYSEGQKLTTAWKSKACAPPSGAIVMTDKERLVAQDMKMNYFLFVVKNIHESPSAAVYRNPFNSKLRFKAERKLIPRTQWTAAVLI